MKYDLQSIVNSDYNAQNVPKNLRKQGWNFNISTKLRWQLINTYAREKETHVYYDSKFYVT